MSRGVSDTDGFLFIYIPQNQRLLRGRSLGEVIQSEVGNVMEAAAAVIGLSGVGMIAGHGGPAFLNPIVRRSLHGSKPRRAAGLGLMYVCNGLAGRPRLLSGIVRHSPA